MRYTVSDYYGDNLFGGLTVCAKTGTGEVAMIRTLTAGWSATQKMRTALSPLPVLYRIRVSASNMPVPWLRPQ